MKITSVSYQKTFSIGPYLTDRVGVEMSLDDTDTPEKALDLAKIVVEDWHKTNNPHLYPEVSIASQWVPEPPVPTTTTYYPSVPKEINIQDEQKEIAIDNAKTLEDLTPLKSGINPGSKLYQQYMSKLKQLTK